MRKVKAFVKEQLGKHDISIVRSSGIHRLEQEAEQLRRVNAGIDFILRLYESQASPLLKSLPNSMSQIRQDLFVLAELNFKTNGFFVEFGAANGKDLSNTHLLEKHFSWDGIVAEPSVSWHQVLRSNRSCNIETDCVWRESNATLTFNEVELAEYSTIDSFSSSDSHSPTRTQGRTYSVNTISLMDLLAKYRAPEIIDYLSIDTEGSEYDILQAFDFSRYQFRVITCEHNFTQQREKIFSLLTRNGYIRKNEEASEFDDWYVRA